MSLRATFANNLKLLRREKGLSQEELAQLAGLDRSYVSLIENKRYSVSIDTIEKLAEVLGVSPARLIEGHQDR